MKFLAALCAFSWIYASDGMIYEDELPHAGVSIGCAGRRMQLNAQMKEVMCVPRHTMVKLIPQPGNIFYPNYASVKRCGGFCPRNKSCMPVQTNIKKIFVRMDSYNSCYHVLLEEHTKCKCQCSVKKHHCNINQVYSEDNCACECMNKKECNKARHMVWDEKLCKCTCNKPEEICTSGLEWVPSRCGCAKVMEAYQEIKSNNDDIGK
ncbi:hypothetical protein P5V15_009113 [Pogonomyrmex californicus]